MGKQDELYSVTGKSKEPLKPRTELDSLHELISFRSVEQEGTKRVQKM